MVLSPRINVEKSRKCFVVNYPDDCSASIKKFLINPSIISAFIIDFIETGLFCKIFTRVSWIKGLFILFEWSKKILTHLDKNILF